MTIRDKKYFAFSYGDKQEKSEHIVNLLRRQNCAREAGPIFFILFTSLKWHSPLLILADQTPWSANPNTLVAIEYMFVKRGIVWPK